jgi:hypothetical protein
MGSPIAGWFTMDNPNLKWMIWGYLYFRTSAYIKPKLFAGTNHQGNDSGVGERG